MLNSSNERSLTVCAIELQAGIAHLRSICGEDDPELLADMIDGELSVDSFVSKLVTMICEDESNCLGLKTYMRKVGDRKKRLENRANRLRVLLASVVANLPSRKFRNQLASVRAFDIEPSVVIDEEADIPTKFWKQVDPVVDVSAIRKHLNQRRKLLEETFQLLHDRRADPTQSQDRPRLSRSSRLSSRQWRHFSFDHGDLAWA